MKLGYKYYRDNLIHLAILTVGCLAIFWDNLHGGGHPDDEPGGLILLGVLMVVGNVGLFIAMRRAKRKEQAELPETAIFWAKGNTSNTKQNPPSDEAATRKRKGMRRFMSCWCIGGGSLFGIFGHDALVNGLPVHWVGYLLILLGILGFAGVNVFYGGPLDLRLDRPQQSPHQLENRK